MREEKGRGRSRIRGAEDKSRERASEKGEID